MNRGAHDVARRIEAASEQVEPSFHFADNFFTGARNNSMLDDEVFVKAWEANRESDADRVIVWRRYLPACAAYHCVQLEGDFVECGAYAGVGVRTVVDYLGGVDFPKDFWLYDLFDPEKGMLNDDMLEHGPDLEKGFGTRSGRHRHPRRLRMGGGLSRPEACRESMVRSAAIPGHAASDGSGYRYHAVRRGNSKQEP